MIIFLIFKVTLVEVDKGHGVNLVAEAQSKAWRYQIGVTQVLTNSTECLYVCLSEA